VLPCVFSQLPIGVMAQGVDNGRHPMKFRLAATIVDDLPGHLQHHRRNDSVLTGLQQMPLRAESSSLLR